MIDKLLALAAVEHRQRIDRPERVDLQQLAHEAVEQCAPRLEQAGVAAAPRAVRGGDRPAATRSCCGRRW